MTRPRVLIALLLIWLHPASVMAQGPVNIRSVFDTSNVQVQVGDAANNAIRVNVVAGGGSGGTSSSFAAAFPATGTAAGARDTSGNMQPFSLDGAGTGQNLKVNCSVGCSGGPADESAFTFGTTAIFTGGVFQTTATNNALTNLQAGVFQVTAQRALFSNLRDASGTELGILATPLRVDPTGTTTQPVSGTFFQATQPVSGTVTANIGTSGSLALDATLSAVQPRRIQDGAGSTLATVTASNALKVDGSAVTQPVSGTVAATQSGTWTVQPGNTANTTAWLVDGSAVTQPVSDRSLSDAGDPTVLERGRMVLAAVARTSPVYPQGRLQPLSLTELGALRTDSSGVTQPVSGAFFQATQPVSGTFFQATQPVSGTVWIRDSSLAPAGTPTTLQPGRMMLASVAPTPPIYNRGQLQPLSLTTLGALRTDSSNTLQPTLPRGLSSEGPAPFTVCDQSAAINTASSGYTQLVPRVAGQAVFVCGYTFVSTSALAVKFAYGTGTACATGTVDMTGAMAVAANGGVVNPVGSVPTLITPGGQAFCVNISVSTQVSGHITYGQF